jgi:hypothetical protein
MVRTSVSKRSVGGRSLLLPLLLSCWAASILPCRAEDKWSDPIQLGNNMSVRFLLFKRNYEGKDNHLWTWSVHNGNNERASGSLIIRGTKADGTSFELKGFEPIFVTSPGGSMGGWAAYTVIARSLDGVKLADLKVGGKVLVESEADRQQRVAKERDEREQQQRAEQERRATEKRQLAERQAAERERVRQETDRRQQEELKRQQDVLAAAQETARRAVSGEIAPEVQRLVDVLLQGLGLDKESSESED